LPIADHPIRAAAPADVDALVRLHLDTVGVAYRDFFPPEAIAPDPEILAGLWRRDLEEAHDVLVATEDDEVIGSVVARRSAELARLHVHPTRWRRGVGRRLHDAAVEVLRAAGHDQIGLWVIEANAPARSLYESAGWCLVPDQQLVELGITEVRYTMSA
jgi:ribosomal protein S18 acetylase RimI-like enzyme